MPKQPIIKRKLKKSIKKNIRKTKTNKKTNDNIVMVGLIHAKWCGHCQALMPNWEIMKNELINDKKFQIIEIEDGDLNKDTIINNLNENLKDKNILLKADGFPTIFKIDNGILEYYKGADREPTSLKTWFSNDTNTKNLQMINNGGKKKQKTKKNILSYFM